MFLEFSVKEQAADDKANPGGYDQRSEYVQRRYGRVRSAPFVFIVLFVAHNHHNAACCHHASANPHPCRSDMLVLIFPEIWNVEVAIAQKAMTG